MSKQIVIIPTYNELENISQIINMVAALTEPFDILIIDDNSPDGTASIAKEIQSKGMHNLYVMERPGKLGLGTAYVDGFKWAIEHEYDFICEMDADFSHPPEKLIALCRACREGADVAVGSRYKSGVNVINWPISRVLLSWFGSLYVRFITGMPIMDTTTGFVCYRRTTLEAVLKYGICMKGYAFQIEMKFTAWKLGFIIVEIPIIFTNRQRGASKMNGGIFKEAIFGIILLKVRSFFSGKK